MAKRLALFLDGTWNTVKSRTNVSTLHALVADQGNGMTQSRYYEPGVGTGRFDSVRGGALGYGLDGNVIDAYRWLVDQYNDGDAIFIFGFSRGAYTARSLAGLVAKCGLLHRGAAMSVAEVYKRYQLDRAARPIYTLDHARDHRGTLTAEEVRLLDCSRRVAIRFIGVWDTVGSLGVPFGNIPGLSRKRYLFHNTRLSNLYETVCHALAIDEHRADFAPTLWTKFTPKVPDPPTPKPRHEPHVEQRWFVGAHADVGGGCETRLNQTALAWMAGKAAEAGLAYAAPPVVEPGAGMDAIFDSQRAFLWGLYRFVRSPFLRPIAAPTEEKPTGFVDTVAEAIDGSVFDRMRGDASYRPANLMAWAKARGVDPLALHGAVDARTGQILR